MARRKTPPNETPAEKIERQLKEKVANTPTRADKVSWNRKRTNLEAFYDKIRPIEDRILDLTAQKQPIFDDMQAIREVMVDECIHPYDYLAVVDGHVMCKFCNRKLKLLDD